MNKRTEKPCQKCGKMFMRRTCPLERPYAFRRRNFCSVLCANRARNVGSEHRPHRRIHPIMLDLRRIRIENNISLIELAKRSGYNRNSIMRYENGLRSPFLWPFADLAELLGYELVLRKKDSALDQRVRGE